MRSPLCAAVHTRPGFFLFQRLRLSRLSCDTFLCRIIFPAKNALSGGVLKLPTQTISAFPVKADAAGGPVPV